MADTFKFSTIVWIILGLLIPFWPISLPICWYLAYRSYKNGKQPAGTITDLQSAFALKQSGAISEEEFQKIKANSLKG